MKSKDLLMMTPGPTMIHESVRMAMSQPILQPDIDPRFLELYKETTQLLAKLLKTKNETLILDGEGILGLEAACASLIEEGDRVLIISNGIFGEGFGDFAKMYGATCVFYRQDFTSPIDIHKLQAFLEEDHNFKIATVVHCETPSGLINPIQQICPLLKQYGILSVVDAVSSIGGMDIETDLWSIDIILGGSQKCLSAPPGLTFLSMSDDAKAAMKSRKTPIRGYYVNLLIWEGYETKKWFPYTQPVSAIYALNAALKRWFDGPDSIERHKEKADYVRRELLDMGFELFPLAGYSNTVTTVKVPEGMDELAFRDALINQYGIMITGAFGPLQGKVLRIGHMGENNAENYIELTIKAIKALVSSMNVFKDSDDIKTGSY